MTKASRVAFPGHVTRVTRKNQVFSGKAKKSSILIHGKPYRQVLGVTARIKACPLAVEYPVSRSFRVGDAFEAVPIEDDQPAIFKVYEISSLPPTQASIYVFSRTANDVRHFGL